MSIVCEPSNVLVFHAPFRRPQTVVLKLTNTKDVPVAFRFQSNPARAFAVKPFSARLKAGKTKEIEVKLRALDTEPPRGSACPHKLKIIYVVLTPELGQRGTRRKFWQKVPSRAVREVRLECRYEFPQGALAIARLRLLELATDAAQRASLAWRAASAATCVSARALDGPDKEPVSVASAQPGEVPGEEGVRDDVLDIGEQMPATEGESAPDAELPKGAIGETARGQLCLQEGQDVVLGEDVESSSEYEDSFEEVPQHEAADSEPGNLPEEALDSIKHIPVLGDVKSSSEVEHPAEAKLKCGATESESRDLSKKGHHLAKEEAHTVILDESENGVVDAISPPHVPRVSEEPSSASPVPTATSSSSSTPNIEDDASGSPANPEVQTLRREVENLRRFMRAMHADWMGPPPEYSSEPDSEAAAQEV